jgi:hypothetical protein
MAIRYAIESHAWGSPAKVLAKEGGKHIYNVQLTDDCDNTNFIARDAWLALDLYSEKAATTFSGIVREQAANGNYYVEVVDPGDALFVYNVPIIEEEFTNNFKKESNFFNAAGDVVRAYELAVGDILEISEAGFVAAPTIGATVALSGKKLA